MDLITRKRELQAERAECLREMRALTVKQISEKRAATADEDATYKRLETRQQELQAPLDRLEKEIEADRELALRTAPAVAVLGNGMGRIDSRADDNALLLRGANGETIRALRPDERMADHTPGAGKCDISIGQYVRAMAFGARNEAERRQLAEGSLGSGGYLVPAPIASMTIDLARAQARCLQAGTLTVPMDSMTLSIARLATDPVAAWRNENSGITPSDPTFEAVILQARSLAALVILSEELAMDAPNIDQVVSNALGQALAGELDRVILRGSGTPPEPKGLLNQTGVQKITHDATLTSYGVMSDAIGKVMAANGTPNAIIMNPREAIVLDKLTAGTDGQPLLPPPSWATVRKYTTTQVPIDLGTPGVEGEIYCGDWTKVVLGVRRELTINISREAGDAYSKLQVWIRAWLRADVGILIPAHMCIVTGVGRAGG
jgi:HK97 family phage major capsid protein